MYDFKTVSIAFIVIIGLSVIVELLFIDLHYLFYLVPCFIYFVLLTWGSFYVNSQFYAPSIVRFSTNKKEIVLSFDDGPDTQITPIILDILKEFEAKAIFFCIGKKIEADSEILKRIHAEEHDIGLHSFSHSYWYDFYPASHVASDLKQNQDIIQKNLGIRPVWFRPPYGVTNPAIGKVFKRGDLTIVGWSVRSLDTVIKDSDKVLRRLIKNTQPGSIVLLHDHLVTTPNILRKYLTFLMDSNYHIVKLSEVIQVKPYVI